MKSYPAEVRPIEVLSAVPGKLHGEPIIVLSVRTNPINTFAVTDVAISMAQAARLVDDLTSLLEPEQPIWAE